MYRNAHGVHGENSRNEFSLSFIVVIGYPMSYSRKMSIACDDVSTWVG